MSGEEKENSNSVESDADESQNTAFDSSLFEAGDDIQESLSENIDIEEEAEDIDKEVEMSLPQIEKRLTQLARAEINSNRQMYRATVYQTMSNERSEWDSDIDHAEKINKIDELIDTAIRVWVDRHLTEFSTAVAEQDESSLTLRDVGRIIVGAGILQGIIERVSSDAVYEYGREISRDLVDWFINNTDLTGHELVNAIDAMFRALFGV